MPRIHLSRAHLCRALAIAAALGVSQQAFADTQPTPVKRPDCSAPEHRAFDFWLGSWRVTSGDQLAGHNTISRSLDGCVLREEWRGAKGTTGSSLNVYNRSRKTWQQFWVDNQGGVLELSGNLDDSGAMVMQGESGGARQRITWRRHEDGSVQQLWEQSADAGKTWNTVFDGRYRHETGADSSAPDS